MCALGEMAAWLPLSSGFTGYATRFVDPALGFAMGYTYWFKYIIGACLGLDMRLPFDPYGTFSYA